MIVQLGRLAPHLHHQPLAEDGVDLLADFVLNPATSGHMPSLLTLGRRLELASADADRIVSASASLGCHGSCTLPADLELMGRSAKVDWLMLVSVCPSEAAFQAVSSMVRMPELRRPALEAFISLQNIVPRNARTTWIHCFSLPLH